MRSSAVPQRPSELPGGGMYRWTRQRGCIVDVLRSEQSHLDAGEIFDIARRRDPRLSLSTVYRTLAFLRDHGVIRELRLGEDHYHYEICRSHEAAPDRAMPAYHSHLVCRMCGAVIEFSSRLLDRLRRELEREHGFTIDHR